MKSIKPGSDSAWPTPKDIEECCGYWYRPDGALHHVTPEFLSANFYDSRKNFDEIMKGFTRIEPIPPQCVPGYEEPEEPDWKAEAVAKYPRVTDED